MYADGDVSSVTQGRLGVEGKSMADGVKALEVPGSWVGAEDLPVHFANAFVGVVGPNAIFLNIGSAVPPSIAGDTEEEREAYARSLTFVPVKPIARIALAPQGLDELIAALEATRANHQDLLQALRTQESHDD
jgi:hypothetical protein